MTRATEVPLHSAPATGRSHHLRPRGLRAVLVLVVSMALAAASLGGVTLGGAPAGADTGSFFSYAGSLRGVPDGTVLRTRTLSYSLDGLPLPIRVVQLLYRTTNERGDAVTNATSVLEPPVGVGDRAVSYQSFYDSLNPADSPSRAIAGGTSFGGDAVHAETALISPLLLQGYRVIVTDTEGATADFAAGPEYGRTTLDGIRAASSSPATGLDQRAQVGLVGYSGGAIATGWASALAPTYAPDVNRRLVGAAEGGVLVDPDHNLHYIQGSTVWAGVLMMAVVGIARAFDLDLEKYLNSYGRTVYATLQSASISSVLGAYPGLTWAQVALPQYSDPDRIPVYVNAVNQLNLGTAAIPTVPMFMGQGADGVLEGTSGSTPGIGAGDGVMVTGDVRALARRYCAAGTPVDYQQYDATSHFTSVPLWLPEALAWLTARFAAAPVASTCGHIAPGNSLTPVPEP